MAADASPMGHGRAMTVRCCKQQTSASRALNYDRAQISTMLSSSWIDVDASMHMGVSSGIR